MSVERREFFATVFKRRFSGDELIRQAVATSKKAALDETPAARTDPPATPVHAIRAISRHAILRLFFEQALVRAAFAACDSF